MYFVISINPPSMMPANNINMIYSYMEYKLLSFFKLSPKHNSNPSINAFYYSLLFISNLSYFLYFN